MDEGFDWYDPEQTGALIESQQAELAAIRQQRDNAVWLAEKQQERIAKLRAENERLRGALRLVKAWVYHFLHYQGQPSLGNPNWEKLQSDYSEIERMLAGEGDK